MSGAIRAPRRVLVLGADGFIGRRVLEALGGCDWAHPIAAGRRIAAQPAADGEAERIRLDATDEQALVKVLRNVDAVVNCVAGKAQTIIDNGHALFAAAENSGRPRIVHLSTMSVYGSATGVVDETSRLHGDLGAYCVAKLTAEYNALHYRRSVILRPGCVYGPGSPQWSGRIAGWLRAGRIGDLGIAGDGWSNLVHVDDVVQAVLRSLTREVEGEIFNLAQPSPPTWNEYFLRYGKALGCVPVQRISARKLKLETRLLAPPLKVAERLGRRFGLHDLPDAIPSSLLGLFRQEIRLDVRKASERLGMRWTPLKQGIEQTAAWYRTGEREARAIEGRIA